MDITLPPGDLAALLDHPLVQGLLEMSSDGAVVIDAQSRQVLAMNSRARDLLGIVGDPMGQPCSDALKSPACLAACPLTRAVHGQPQPGLTTLYLRRQDDGRVVHADARMLIVRDPQGRPTAGIELLADRRELHALERALRSRRSVLGLVGRSAVMQAVYERIESLGPCDMPVLVTGPPGVGKRRVAEALHATSTRSARPLVVTAVGALPAGMQARAIRAGIQQARGGTAVLADVDDLDPRLATALAALVRTAACAWADGPMEIRDTRLVFTGHRVAPVLAVVLADAVLPVPALEERLDDLGLLVDDLLASTGGAASVDSTALAALARQRWPGNVGQLARVLAAAAARAGADGQIGVTELELPTGPGGGSTFQIGTLADAERAAIRRALDQTQGNVSAAARVLGIDRSTLWRKLKRLEERTSNSSSEPRRCSS